MTKTRFPKTLAAVERAETTDKWAIADALLSEIPPVRPGTDSEAVDQFASCATELAAHGYEYAINTLRSMRDTAVAFPEKARRRAFSFFAHAEARDPETLDLIVARAKREGVPPSGRYVRETRKAIDAERHVQWERATARTRAAAEKKLERAKEREDRAAIKEAQEEIRAARAVPKRGRVEEHAVDQRVLELKIQNLAADATKAAREAVRLMEGQRFGDDALDAIRSSALEAMNTWARIAQPAEGSSRQRRGLVAAV